MRAAWMDLRGLMLSKRQRHGRFAYVYLMMLRSHEVVVVVKSLPHLVASLGDRQRAGRYKITHCASKIPELVPKSYERDLPYAP